MKKNKNEISVKKPNFLERKLGKLIEPVVSEQMLVACIIYFKNYRDELVTFDSNNNIDIICDDEFIIDFINEYKCVLETVHSGINDYYVAFAEKFYNILAGKGVEY